MRMADCHPNRPHAAKGMCASCYMVEYQRTPKGKANHRKCNKKYKGSVKGKEAEVRHRKTESRKRALKKYNGSDKRKSTQLRYDYGIDLEEYEALLNLQDGK